MRKKHNKQRTICEVLGKTPEPKELKHMSLVLDANPEILYLTFPNLTKGRRTDMGRDGMTAEQVLCYSVLK